jgi:hypothetical protein
MAGLAVFVMALGISARGEAKEGAYQVPVPARLADFARFTLAHVGEKVGDGRLDIYYTLPPEIVGEPGISIHLSGPLDENGFSRVVDSSNGSEGYCLKSEGAERTCLIRYPEIEVDADAAEKFLKQSFKASELDSRREVVQIFKDDPAGLLTIH